MSAEPPRLMAIRSFAKTDEASIRQEVRRLVEYGVDALQVRDKTIDDRRLEHIVRLAVEAAQGHLSVLVNGRADLAIACGADGVHLPSMAIPAAAVRRAFPDLLIGLSTHDVAEIVAVRGAVDYVTFSPIFETPSETRRGELKGRPQGPGALARATREGVPVLALGGISADRLETVAKAGAHGVAAIRALQDPALLVEMAAQARRFFPLAAPGRAAP